MSHLGERVADLVDGQLTPAEAERANAHLAGCRDCREAAELERLTKQRLHLLPDVAPSPQLMAVLLGIGGPQGPLPPRPGHVPGMPRRNTVAVDSGPAGSRRPQVHRPAGQPSTSPGRRRRSPTRRVAAAVAVGLCLVGVGVVGIAVTTGPAQVVPPVNTFVVDHATTTGTLPFGERQVGWLTGGEAGK